MQKINVSKTKKIIRKYRNEKGILIQLLQDIQDIYGFVPEESVKIVSRELSVSPVEIYGILTFYAQFRAAAPGRHIIKVCQGTACHVMGGKEIYNYLTEKLGITEKEVTKNGVFSIERVACLGCCGMAPVVAIDKNFYGGCTIKKVEELLEKYESK